MNTKFSNFVNQPKVQSAKKFAIDVAKITATYVVVAGVAVVGTILVAAAIGAMQAKEEKPVETEEQTEEVAEVVEEA